MDDQTEIRRMEEVLLGVLPWWNYRLAKPFKELLDEGVSLEMYYCIQILRCVGKPITMSELAQFARMPKQQMTKMVNRLVEPGFVERVYDPSDRRVIRIRLTEKASSYIDQFLDQNAGYFRKFLEQIEEGEREEFMKAVEILLRVLPKLPYTEPEA
ncbi:MAG TPA: winged helix DNA-binding protein [Candidatus Merdivicinus intestinavium]|nr:winged helix DNA-binding protein [Candidatus Merdivicinus intestinavium]